MSNSAVYDFPPLLKGSLHNSGEHARKEENATEKPQETAAECKDLIPHETIWNAFT